MRKLPRNKFKNIYTRDDAPLDTSVFAFLLRDLKALLLGFGTTCCDTRFRLIVDTVTFDDVVADSLVMLLVVRPGTLTLGSAAIGCWDCIRSQSGRVTGIKLTFRGRPTLFLEGTL
jgi:hypothetical protein